MADRDRTGYILIDRNILEWKYWQKHNTLIVFLWLLLKAQFHESYFAGVKIERGQVATSIEGIMSTCNLSRQEVKTALVHLKTNGEITTARHSQFLVITIVNYSKYQDLNIKSNINQTSDKHQSNINQTHTNTLNTRNTRNADKRRNTRSAQNPDEPVRGTPQFKAKSHLLLERDEGTLDDIPDKFRSDYTSFAEYWDRRNQ